MGPFAGRRRAVPAVEPGGAAGAEPAGAQDRGGGPAAGGKTTSRERVGVAFHATD